MRDLVNNNLKNNHVFNLNQYTVNNIKHDIINNKVDKISSQIQNNLEYKSLSPELYIEKFNISKNNINQNNNDNSEVSEIFHNQSSKLKNKSQPEIRNNILLDNLFENNKSLNKLNYFDNIKKINRIIV